jgi:FdhD protein
MSLRPPSVAVPRQAVGGPAPGPGTRHVPEETAIALVYDGGSEAVMMATPADLEDMAYGFSLNEGLIRQISDVQRLEIAQGALGIELQLWLTPGLGEKLVARRRHRAGPTGCGLCGVESLADAMPAIAPVQSDVRIDAADLMAAMEAMSGDQRLNHLTHAVHAAGFYLPGQGVVLVREDVGRHNALDKLAGAMARQGLPARDGAVLMTSRLSVELVQKAAAMGTGLLAAVSAPTALAIRTADAAGMTLAGIVRADGLEVFTHPGRVLMMKGKNHADR